MKNIWNPQFWGAFVLSFLLFIQSMSVTYNLGCHTEKLSPVLTIAFLVLWIVGIFLVMTKQ